MLPPQEPVPRRSSVYAYLPSGEITNAYGALPLNVIMLATVLVTTLNVMKFPDVIGSPPFQLSGRLERYNVPVCCIVVVEVDVDVDVDVDEEVEEDVDVEVELVDVDVDVEEDVVVDEKGDMVVVEDVVVEEICMVVVEVEVDVIVVVIIASAMPLAFQLPPNL